MMLPIIIMEIADENDRAFAAQMFEDYHMMMLRIAWNYLREPMDVEDVVSSTFISLIKNLQKVQALEEGERRAYITVAVKRSCLMLMRKRSGHTDVEFNADIADHQTDTAPQPDEAVIQRYQQEVLKQVVKQLTLEEQMMFQMKFIERRRDIAIALEFKCTPNAMRTRYVRLRKKIRKLYLEIDPDVMSTD